MNYLSDYKKMMENRFIQFSLLDGLDPIYQRELEHRISFLTKTLNDLSISNNNTAVSVLQTMSELACIKSVLEMKVRVNVLSDAKNKEKRYLQARGAVPVAKGSRIWAGYYLGPERAFKNGKDDPKAVMEGRTEVVKRVLEGLRNAMGL